MPTSSFFSGKTWFIYVIGILSGVLPVIFFAIGLEEFTIFPIAFLLVWMAISYPYEYVILTAALVPLSLQMDDIGGGLGLSIPTEPMMIFFVVLLVLRWLLKPSVSLEFIRQPIVWATILYLFWYFITSLTSTMPVISLKSLIARCWFAGIFFFYLSHRLDTRNNIQWLLFAMIIGATIMVSYTLIRHGAEGFVRLHSYTIMRPFFIDHGIYAAFLAFFIPILFVFGFYGEQFSLSPWWRVIFMGLFIIFLMGILFSYTRATWISIIGMLGLGVAIRYGVTFKQIIYFLCLAVGVFIWKNDTIIYELSRNKQDSAEQLEDHIKSVSNISTDPSNLERINRWKSAVEMAKEKPWLGFGPYTYTFQYAPYQRPQDLTLISTHAGTLGNAHSEYFMALSEMGIPGLLLILTLFLSSIYTGIRIYRKARIPWVRTLAIAVTLGLSTYYIHGLLNNYTEYDKIGVPLWGFLALLTALDVYHSQRTFSDEHSGSDS
jgi:putative inorganic carbon (HCO3(-)) transporter